MLIYDLIYERISGSILGSANVRKGNRAKMRFKIMDFEEKFREFWVFNSVLPI